MVESVGVKSLLNAVYMANEERVSSASIESSERTLWLAVIIRALRDVSPKFANMGVSWQEYRDTKAWLSMQCADFLRVCDLAGTHPREVLKAARKLQIDV